MIRFLRFLTLLTTLLTLAACEISTATPTRETSLPTGNTYRVIRVIDGDTIDVDIDGREHRVRYIGVNTPERDESCYSDATAANRQLVEGQYVRLVKDTSETDRYDRLLRYVYVGETFVNAQLVRDGWAEVVRYTPDTREFGNFRSLEQSAAGASLGCHPTGIFNDGTYER